MKFGHKRKGRKHKGGFGISGKGILVMLVIGGALIYFMKKKGGKLI